MQLSFKMRELYQHSVVERQAFSEELLFKDILPVIFLFLIVFHPILTFSDAQYQG